MFKQKLINFYCNILFFIALVKARLSGKRIPLMANILVTDRCNLKCFYCFVDSEHRTGEDIPFEKLLALIDTLYQNGARLIILLGGEPMLYKRIDEVIHYIKKKRMLCEVIINGYLAEEHLDALALCDSVCISLDGDEASHDKNRGRGSYQQAVQAIKLLRKRKVAVRIKTVITKNNCDCLEFLSQYAKENGLMLTVSVPATYDTRVYAQHDQWLNEDQKRNFLNQLLSLKKKGFPIGYSFTALNYILRWPYAEELIIKRDRTNHTEEFRLLRCGRKDYSLYIDADGCMYPCAHQWGKNKTNVFTDGFDSCWQNMANYDCSACGSLPDIDITYLLSCNWENIYRAIRFFGIRIE